MTQGTILQFKGRPIDPHARLREVAKDIEALRERLLRLEAERDDIFSSLAREALPVKPRERKPYKVKLSRPCVNCGVKTEWRLGNGEVSHVKTCPLPRSVGTASTTTWNLLMDEEVND